MIHAIGTSSRLKWLSAIALGLTLALPGISTASNEFPSKVVRFVVPFGAGGANDITARRLHDIVNRQNQEYRFVVDNVVGADGTIGMSRVAGAEPDGYTIGMSASTILGNIAIGKSRLKVESFQPIARVSTDPLILVVSAKSPHQNLDDFIRHLRNNPETVTMASPSLNNLNHMFALLTGRAANAKPVIVAYPSGAKALADTIGGQVDFTITKPSETRGFIQSGMARALAVFAQERIDLYPELPTMKEKGFDVFPYGPMVQMSYIVAPSGLPDTVRNKLISIYREAILSPEFRKFADESGFLVDDLTGGEMEKVVNDVYSGIKHVADRVLSVP